MVDTELHSGWFVIPVREGTDMNRRTLAAVLTWLILVWFALDAAGEDETNALTFDGKDYLLEIAHISENRVLSGNLGRCSLRVEFASLGPEWVLTHVELVKAQDDTGKDLVRERTAKLRHSLWVASKKSKSGFRISLSQSDRRAKEIREVQGFLHLQKSGAGAKVVLRDFAAWAGEYAVSDELKQLGIEAAYVNAETFDDKGGNLVMGLLTPAAQLADLSEAQKKGPLAMAKAMVSQPNTIVVLVKDPMEKLLKLEAADSRTGRTAKAVTSTQGMYIIPTSATLGDEEKQPPAFDELHLCTGSS
jgi:hypothetical protein